MHRSGTTLLSQALINHGLFMGKYREKNEEALFFLKLNSWMLRQANATWDAPENFLHGSDKFYERMARVCEDHVRSPFKFLKYLGLNRFANKDSIRKSKISWGWKDPRTTFTLPVWQKIYPEAKILHIYRNPVDVAQSLRKRAIMEEISFRPNIATRLKENLLIGRIPYTGSFNVMNLYNGFKLWSLYVNKALQYEGALHIKYEDLLQSPQPTLSKIIRSVNLEVDETTMALTAGQFDKSRRFAFVKSDELCTFYERIKSDPLVKKLGYSDIL